MNSTKLPMEEAQGSGWLTGGGQLVMCCITCYINIVNNHQ